MCLPTPLQRTRRTRLDELRRQLLGYPRIMLPDHRARLVSPAVPRADVAIAKQLVELLHDRHGPVFVQDDGGVTDLVCARPTHHRALQFERCLFRVRVCVREQLRPGPRPALAPHPNPNTTGDSLHRPTQRKHLAHPKPKLRRLDCTRLGLVQHVPDFVEHGLRDERLVAFARAQAVQVACFDAFVLGVGWQAGMVRWDVCVGVHGWDGQGGWEVPREVSIS